MARERVGRVEPLGGILGSHVGPRGVVLVVNQHRAAGEPELGRAVVGDQEQVRVVACDDVLRVVLDAGSPPTDRRGRGRGAVRVDRQTSRVSRLSAVISTTWLLRVVRTVSSNRSSGSSSTSTSPAGVPSRWRQIWWGR
ncbi:MAG: hypothetical protein QM655_12785 [Nocardioidaceae bacterium]